MQETTSPKIILEKYNEAFLQFSWKWLNDPEIKKLTNTPDFSKESQAAWFKSLPDKKNYKIWGVSFDGIPIGVFGIKNIQNAEGEYWGYIGDKQYWGKGIGEIIMKLIIKEAKNSDLNKLYLKVIPDNPRAIKLYEKLGFTTESQNEELILMAKAI